jgi:ATP-binding cassette subfamily B protein
LIIAHRLSTLRDADELVVLDKKTVAEQGTPDALLKQKGIYYTLYKLQTEALKTIGISED